jgi:alkylation response protein AidB-like acyl-CoA dehydrogenase
VYLPAPLRDALTDHLGSDLLALDLPNELSGTRIPPSLRWAATEFVMGANPAIGMATQLVPQVVTLLLRHGTPYQQRLAELILERRWTVTMVLTEAEAGSDVGAARTRALPQPDGTWHVKGTKRFITWGEHDGADNVVHLVLARPADTPGAGGSGTKGLSLFVVPSHHYDDSGTVTGRNGVVCTGLEHKMGVSGSPTCELTFGVDSPAVGTLLGDVHDGIRQMFEIITYVRMLVGLKAGAALSTAYLNAREYASTRVQGGPMVSLSESGSEPVPITDHPDVRRSLLTQRAYAEGARALVLYTATLLDQVEAAALAGRADPEANARHRLLLPVVKGWSSESAWRVIGSHCLQTLGGTGYLRDHPVEQYARDTKIDTIYEGTTGIQALDLLSRRVVRDKGVALETLFEDIRSTAHELAGGSLADEALLLHEAVDEVRDLAALAIARAVSAPRLAALSATPLLLALGDLVVAWLLLRAAAVAQEARGDRDEVRAGRIAAARQFARDVLPHLAATSMTAQLADPEVLSLPATAL